MTTIDELLQKHPVPWEMRVMTCGESAGDQWACDANGEKVFCIADVYSEDAQALLDAMSELVRLRVETQAGARNYNDLRNFSDGLMLACDGLRARNAELEAENVRLNEYIAQNPGASAELDAALARNAVLEAYVVRMRDAPKRLAEAIWRGDQVSARDVGDAVEGGMFNESIFGEGGEG